MAPGVVVIGLGNPDRGDDGAGPAVAWQIEKGATRPVATVVRRSDPIALVEDWAGAEVAYLVDASLSGLPAGAVRRVEVGDVRLGSGAGGRSSHGLDVDEAIELARALGRLPPRLIVFIVEGRDFRLGVGLSRQVEVATREVADRILDEIGCRDRPCWGVVETDGWPNCYDRVAASYAASNRLVLRASPASPMSIRFIT